jgi:hypothetical protein
MFRLMRQIPEASVSAAASNQGKQGIKRRLVKGMPSNTRLSPWRRVRV